MTTWTFHVLKVWNSDDSSTVVDESTHRRYDGSTSTVTSSSIRVDSTTSPTHLRSYSRNIFYFTSGVTGRHQLWRVIRFDKIRNPLSWPLAEYFLNVLLIDFWYDGSTGPTETSRSIRQHFQQPLTVTCEIFPKWFANWLPVGVFIKWEMVNRISGTTRRINRMKR